MLPGPGNRVMGVRIFMKHVVAFDWHLDLVIVQNALAAGISCSFLDGFLQQSQPKANSMLVDPKRDPFVLVGETDKEGQRRAQEEAPRIPNNDQIH